MGISSSQLTFTHSFQRGRLNHQPDLDDHFRSKEKHMSRIRLVSLPVFPKILLHDVKKKITVPGSNSVRYFDYSSTLGLYVFGDQW